MKKVAILLLALLPLSVSSTQAAECSVNYIINDSKIGTVIRANGWGFENYDAICNKLRNANAKLVIQGNAVVLANKSIAYADITIADNNELIMTSSFGGTSVQVHEYASQNTADKILMDAINGAVNSMNIDKAIGALNVVRNNAKDFYSKPKK